MELRSSCKDDQKTEYEEFQITLSGMGFYEDGMALQEMRDICEVLNIAKNGRNLNDPQSSNGNALLNSTMLPGAQNRCLESPESSPITCAEKITFKADVHHSLDWSPSKSNADSPEIDNSVRKRNIEILNSTIAIKRLCLNSIESEIIDSGVGCSMNSNAVIDMPQALAVPADNAASLDLSFSTTILSDESFFGTTVQENEKSPIEHEPMEDFPIVYEDQPMCLVKKMPKTEVPENPQPLDLNIKDNEATEDNADTLLPIVYENQAMSSVGELQKMEVPENLQPINLNIKDNEASKNPLLPEATHSPKDNESNNPINELDSNQQTAECPVDLDQLPEEKTDEMNIN